MIRRPDTTMVTRFSFLEDPRVDRTKLDPPPELAFPGAKHQLKFTRFHASGSLLVVMQALT
jgi:hypothetical protein